jgi:hypothetical protein
LLVGAKMFAPAQAPFASAAGCLDPRNTDAVSDVSRPYTRTDRDNLTHGFVAENSRERAQKMSERFVNIGLANTARMHLDENLIRTQLGLRNVLNFPWTVHGSDNGSSHEIPPPGFDVGKCGLELILSDSVCPSSAFRHFGMPETKMLGV